MTSEAFDRSLAAHALRALFEFAQLDGRADASVLGRALGLRTSAAARLLLALDAHGLVCAERARLTLSGLARAVRLPALDLAGEPWLAEVGFCSRAQPCTSSCGYTRSS